MTMWEYLFRWETLWWTLIALYIPTCLGLIAIVLLQKGKGVGFAGAFGMGGGSEAVFGPRGSVNFPVRLTYILATVFMVLSLSMSLVAGRLGMGIAPETLDPAAQAQIEEEEIEGEGFGGFDIEDMDPDAPMEMPDEDAPMVMPDAEDLEFTDPEADVEIDPEIELTPEPEEEPEIELAPEPEEEAEEVDPEADAEPEADEEPDSEANGDEEDAEADEDTEQTGEEESEPEQQ